MRLFSYNNIYYPGINSVLRLLQSNKTRLIKLYYLNPPRMLKPFALFDTSIKVFGHFQFHDVSAPKNTSKDYKFMEYSCISISIFGHL